MKHAMVYRGWLVCWVESGGNYRAARGGGFNTVGSWMEGADLEGLLERIDGVEVDPPEVAVTSAWSLGG